MIFLSVLLNVIAWIVAGYLLGNYFARYSRCGNFCAETAGVFGALTGGVLTFIAYGLPSTILWANNLLFAFVGSLGLIYISLPEAERSAKVEQIIRSVKKLNKWYIDLAGLKR